MREKLIELLASKACGIYSPTCDEWGTHDCGKCYANNCSFSDLAAHLIQNGLTIPVRCKDCKEWWPYGPSGLGTCRNPLLTEPQITSKDDFCSYGERRAET